MLHLNKCFKYFSRKEQPDLDLQSPVLCWFQMLEQCQRESKDHGMLSTIYLNHIIPRLQMLSEDVGRLHKKVGNKYVFSWMMWGV